MSKVPYKLQMHLGSYEPLLFDKACGEPIAWGYELLNKDITEIEKKELEKYGQLINFVLRKYLIIKWISFDYAVAKYGGNIKAVYSKVTGRFKSVTFGKTTFTTKILNPKSEENIKKRIETGKGL